MECKGKANNLLFQKKVNGYFPTSFFCPFAFANVRDKNGLLIYYTVHQQNTTKVNFPLFLFVHLYNSS